MSFATLAMLLGGVGLFLFGMSYFEDTIRTAFGSGIKDTIQRYAWGLARSMGIGIVATTILQSSLIVIMIMLGFIGAGILTLPQGIGVVLGTNIGTTLTPWLIALVWFKMDIEALTLPIIALGWILLIAWSRYPKLKSASKFLIGFGLLFLWLSYMKESVDVLAASFSLEGMNLNLATSILIWLIVTVVMQTSTGSTILTLTALSSGMISFDIALGIIIGANLGSAVSTFIVGYLGSDRTQKLKRLVAATHLGSNALMMIVMIILLKPIARVMAMTGLTDDPVIGIAAFHTIYNVVWVAVLLPFVQRFVDYADKRGWIPTHNQFEFAILQRSTDLPEEYLSWMRHDVKSFIKDAITFIEEMRNPQETDPVKLVEHYTSIKADMHEWMSIVLMYDPGLEELDADISVKQAEKFERYQIVVAGFLNAIKQLKDMSLDYYELKQDKTDFIQDYMQKFDEKLDAMIDVAQRLLDDRKSASTLQRVKTMLREMSLDDSSFLREIRASIARYNKKSHYQKALSQLIQLNRSIVGSGAMILRASSYYIGYKDLTKLDMLSAQ